MNADDFRFRALEWAVAEFSSEIKSGFIKSMSFDSLFSQCCIATVLGFARSDLLVLGTALPQQAMIADKPLTNQELQIVGQFRQKCYDKLTGSSQACAAIMMRGLELETRALHKEVSIEAKRICRCLAKVHHAKFFAAGSKEWALVKMYGNYRFCLSFVFAANCQLSYFISVIQLPQGEIVIPQRNYLGTLGIGLGECNFLDVKDANHKLKCTLEFALWHMNELLRLWRE